MEVLNSCLDQSVNFIWEQDKGMFEARYVRRQEDYFIVYLSSQSGCNKACRFCHLTQTGQTQSVDATLADYFQQADTVLEHYDQQPSARIVHYNFMSRGEVFANQYLLSGQGDQLISGLAEKATSRGLIPRMKFSTIMPKELEEFQLVELFPSFNPDIYYSLYSMDPAFRRRWLPKALAAENALEKLVDYQQTTRKIPVLHWAFIEGENDDEQTITDICQAVNKAGLKVDFNIVRYNPYSDKQGQEPPVEVLEKAAMIMAESVPGAEVKIVGRVGFDVKASCGMFVGGKR